MNLQKKNGKRKVIPLQRLVAIYSEKFIRLKEQIKILNIIL